MKALIVCTNHKDYPTKPHKTGLWLSELTHFYDEIADRNFTIDIASPNGGFIPIDERSLDRRDNINEKWYQNPEIRHKLENSVSLADVATETYQLLYLTGGHGTMWDFPENVQLQDITRRIYETGGMVSAVCHGVCGLLNVRLSDGSYLLNDKQVTGFSNMEEKLIRLNEEVPFLLEDELKKKNAHYSKGLIPFLPHLEVDERLVTGQNPLSARKVGRKVLEEMFEK
ncbi:type 1 glutamine amidotransferase domain-containing protein [Rudanella paleaurantiibacter]|uniref:Type 1 glutamine amidotransferase domain-containing protein n=1 Tax=Rudanella paleaurantiibacter TaxID=2614655 RepID=A0A7J5TWY6_9BACT|nr:type 1 glutamine amidotransferase domain-containing protein [Rudanella paleaurantiibacter]KAB7729144.1 type 1 glutamine amidotransferase domain-containing protein [Rudanella paleaurantiibacter]